MRVYEAEDIKNKFTNALANKKAQFCQLSLLFCSDKKLLIDAYKIYMAYIIKHPIIKKEHFQRLMDCLLFIDYFTTDKEADRLNNIYEKRKLNKHIKPDEELYYNNYLKCFLEDRKNNSHKYYDEVSKFINTINPLNHNSQEYCNTVYKLAKVEYKPEYEVDFAR
ncbi:MAG: hypothetical protein ACYCX2_02155 [Christensenellales bacterium]